MGIIHMFKKLSTLSKSYAKTTIAVFLVGFIILYILFVIEEAVSEATRVQQIPLLDNLDRSLAQAGSYSKLNIGKMSAFEFQKEPRMLPDIRFRNSAGKLISLRGFSNKVILLNIWATWCAPCLREMPHLNELQSRLGSDTFEVVAVSLDAGSPEKPKKLLRKISVDALHFYHDPTAQLSFTLKALGMPTTLLIDNNGREIGRLVGAADWSSTDASRLINAYLPN
ncbi:MAG: Thiol:disulfide interchange protein TlpA [Hyphomicrobiaceae bacterium hypho_1]